MWWRVSLLSLLWCGCFQGVAGWGRTVKGMDDLEIMEQITTFPARDGLLTTLDTVRRRGYLRCGITYNNVIFGRRLVDPANPDGVIFVGFDVDICRAISIAVLGTDQRIQFVEVAPEKRFHDLLYGHFDVLFATSTITIGRDMGNHVSFSPVIFHDGTGFMVKENDGFTTAAELNQKDLSYCVAAGTSTEATVRSVLRSKAVHTLGLEESLARFADLECDYVVDDKGSMASAVQQGWVILEETIARSPLAAGTRDWDKQWTNIVNWVINGLIIAEEYEINSVNVNTTQDGIQREAWHMLNSNGSLPLRPGFMRDVIFTVGNYADIYGRHAEAYVPRKGSGNALYLNGGLIVADGVWVPSDDVAEPAPPLWTRITESNLDTQSLVHKRYQSVVNSRTLRCGVPNDDPIYASLSNGAHTGFAVDICNAIAASFENEGNVGQRFEVKYAMVNETEALSGLNAGSYDVLIHRVVKSIGHEVKNGIVFSPTIFHDGIGMVVAATSPIKGLKTIQQPDPITKVFFKVCVQNHTLVQQYVDVYIIRPPMETVESIPQGMEFLKFGRCQAFIGLKSQLPAFVLQEQKVLPVLYSRIPYAVATRGSDITWSDTVHWVINGLHISEFYGMTGANVGSIDLKVLPDEAAMLLGKTDVVYPEMYGLRQLKPFFGGILKQVGNFAEIYARHWQSIIPREGTRNQLWDKQGGLLFPGLWSPSPNFDGALDPPGETHITIMFVLYGLMAATIIAVSILELRAGHRGRSLVPSGLGRSREK